jgi:hypothetical protein
MSGNNLINQIRSAETPRRLVNQNIQKLVNHGEILQKTKFLNKIMADICGPVRCKACNGLSVSHCVLEFEEFRQLYLAENRTRNVLKHAILGADDVEVQDMAGEDLKRARRFVSFAQNYLVVPYSIILLGHRSDPNTLRQIAGMTSSQDVKAMIKIELENMKNRLKGEPVDYETREEIHLSALKYFGLDRFIGAWIKRIPLISKGLEMEALEKRLDIASDIAKVSGLMDFSLSYAGMAKEATDSDDLLTGLWCLTVLYRATPVPLGEIKDVAVHARNDELQKIAKRIVEETRHANSKRHKRLDAHPDTGSK